MSLFAASIGIADYVSRLVADVFKVGYLRKSRMFIYSGLLIALNSRFLPEPIKVRGIRLGALAWCFAFFGVFSIIYGVEQFKQLF